MSGVLINKFNGNSTSIPVSLRQGLYIVQADGKAAKLLVASNGNGGTSVQPEIVGNVVPGPASTVTQSTSAANAPTLFRAVSAAFNQYWNIDAGGTITPVEIAKVNTFYITPDNVIVFNMTDGNTVQLTQYHSTSYSTTPTASQNIDWDMTKTILYGGATYAWGYDDPPAITFAAVHKNGLAFHSVMNGYLLEDNRIYNSAINNQLWDAGSNPNSRLAVFFTASSTHYGMSYSGIVGDFQVIYLMTEQTGIYSVVRADSWPYNNNSNLIPTTFVKDGTKVTMTCVDISGKPLSYTFDTW